MQVLDRAKEKFDAQGQPGVAEERAVRNVNRWRAAGVVTKSVLGLVGIAVAVGGFRHDGLDGAAREVGQALSSPLRNKQGDWDMPIFDVRGSKPEMTFEFSRSGDLTEAAGSLACPTHVERVELDGRFVSSAVYDLNEPYIAHLGSEQALDALWANYFAGDNNGADPNNPQTDTVNLRRLETIDNCEIR